jgi:hypothetical protein
MPSSRYRWEVGITMANTGAGLARVIIVGPSRRLSLALPERVPLATLLPSVLAQAGEQVEQGPSDKPVGQPVTGWALRRSDGPVPGAAASTGRRRPPGAPACSGPPRSWSSRS